MPSNKQYSMEFYYSQGHSVAVVGVKISTILLSTQRVYRVLLSLSKHWEAYKVTSRGSIDPAGLTFQTLTLLQKYLYSQSQYSNTWDRKCLAPIAQMVRAFGMNPKVVGSSSPQVVTFSQKHWHFDKNTRSYVQNECCCPPTVDIVDVKFT